MARTAAQMSYGEFVDTFLWIRDKKGMIIPFIRSPIQRRVEQIIRERSAEGCQYFNVLKYRRGGITTAEQAKNFYTIMKPGKSVVTLADEAKNTEKIFKISQLFYKKLNSRYRPLRSKKVRRELEFPELNSDFYIGTAGAKNFGRGSTLQRFHGSEVAFWPGSNSDINTLVASLTEAASHGIGVLESTANGSTNWFYQQWQEVKDGKAKWANIFLPWFDDFTNVEAFESEDERQALLETMTPEEEDVREKYGLSPEQLKWRRLKKSTLRKLFPQEYPETDEEAFLVSGATYFDTEIVTHLIKISTPPPIQKFKDRRSGRYLYREWKPPIPGRRYVAGTDVAAGINDDGHDYTTTVILDAVTGEHVATVKAKMKPNLYGDFVAPILERYGTPEWAIERNEYGLALIAHATSVLNYRKLYRHTTTDKVTRQVRQELGWPTNKKTRPLLVGALATAIEQEDLKTNDKEFLGQCITFTLSSSGRFEAASGCFDDDLFAAGIAWQIAARGARKPSVIV